MKIYVFGNPDVEGDDLAIKTAKKLEGRIKNLEFVFVMPNEELSFKEGEDVVIMDVVEGIEEVKVFTDKDLDKLELLHRGSVHDYDLGFQLQYLQKLGKLGRVKIIGVPKKWKNGLMRVVLRSILS